MVFLFESMLNHHKYNGIQKTLSIVKKLPERFIIFGNKACSISVIFMLVIHLPTRGRVVWKGMVGEEGLEPPTY